MDGFIVREAGKRLTQAIERQEPEKVIFHSCEAVFAALQTLHNIGFDVSEFNSVFRDYVDYKFELITDSEAKEPDFKYDIPSECVFDNGFANPDGTAKKETVKGPYHKDNLPDFDDLIGNVIAKRQEAESE